MRQSLAILIAITIGIFIPAAQQLTFIIRYTLMVMLFFAFLQARFSTRVLHYNHFLVLVLNVSLPLVYYFLLRFIDPYLALAIFTISIAPTAAGAPVITSFLKRDVSYVTLSVLITSPVIALVIPPILSGILANTSSNFSAWEIASPIFSLLFIPLGLSLLLRWLWKAGAQKLMRLNKISFYLFLINVFIAGAKASAFIQAQEQEALLLAAGIALATGVVCIFQFKLGEWIGRKHLPIETGMALGRKNTMFGIWLALTFINPLAALGPMSYIIFQNMYNAWQMYQMDKEEQLE